MTTQPSPPSPNTGQAEHRPDPPIGDRRTARLLMQVLWPAFMVAVIGEGLVFSLIDPHELVVVGVHLAHSREAAYTIGLFML
jgi:hypothetical protein